MTRRDSYNEEFKRNAVWSNLSEEHGVKTAAKKLGVSTSCLCSWIHIDCMFLV
ncbi:MAG: transposase [Proteobacteria bacterium]|nr:transposase [Pseudomonadota bacterium]